MTLGMMMSLTYIIGQLSGPIGSFIGFVQQLQDAKISLERLNEVHGKEDEEQNIESKLTLLPEERDICIEGLSFSYDGAERDYVLEDLNLHISERKVTAIVGASGSGKTTLIKLLLGFYTPNKGKIKLGETPLENINPHLWRSRTGSVMQDGFIFSESIAQNIAVGEEQIDIERLRHAVTVANIRDFIDSLPLGYNTKIGMEGNGISQGQRQRILIARAVYKNPEFLFFDEATNALDANNEKEIMEHLHEFYKGKTVVVVAHRLSTVKDADKIVQEQLRHSRFSNTKRYLYGRKIIARKKKPKEKTEIEDVEPITDVNLEDYSIQEFYDLASELDSRDLTDQEKRSLYNYMGSEYRDMNKVLNNKDFNVPIIYCRTLIQ